MAKVAGAAILGSSSRGGSSSSQGYGTEGGRARVPLRRSCGRGSTRFAHFTFSHSRTPGSPMSPDSLPSGADLERILEAAELAQYEDFFQALLDRADAHYEGAGVRRWMLQLLPHVEPDGFVEVAGPRCGHPPAGVGEVRGVLLAGGYRPIGAVGGAVGPGGFVARTGAMAPPSGPGWRSARGHRRDVPFRERSGPHRLAHLREHPAGALTPGRAIGIRGSAGRRRPGELGTSEARGLSSQKLRMRCGRREPGRLLGRLCAPR